MATGDLRRLRRHPGYPLFYATATITRLADEMFSVGVVLLVLHRTGSAALAGATVAAVTLPSLVTGPLLGAWLDRAGDRRRQAMILDQVLAATSLVGIVAAGRQRARTGRVPLVALVAGHHLAALVRRLHEPDPGDRARTSCWRRRTRSRRRASTSRSSPARRWRGRSPPSRSPAASLLVEAVLTLGRDRADRARCPRWTPRRTASTRAARRRSCSAGLLHLVRDAGAARCQRPGALSPRRPRPADGRVPVLRGRRAGRGSQRGRLHVGGVRVGLDDRRAAAGPAPDAVAPGARRCSPRSSALGLRDAARGRWRRRCRRRWP